jgi:CheY-like chemotaxis protein
MARYRLSVVGDRSYRRDVAAPLISVPHQLGPRYGNVNRFHPQETGLAFCRRGRRPPLSQHLSISPEPNLPATAYLAAGSLRRSLRGESILEDLVAILVVEDDQLIQGMVEEALTDAGYEPATTTSGNEAVTRLREYKSKYRALVTDIDLGGGLDGWAIAQQAREIDPAFPIVYMSGAHAEDWASKGVPNSIMLAKPFAPAQLVTAVSNLLNTGTPTA